MTRHIQLKKITLMSGESLDVSPGVTVIVGPNNTGKSSLLREVSTQASLHPGQWPSRQRLVVDSVEFNFVGSADDLIAELETTYQRRPAGSHPEGFFHEDTFRMRNGGVLHLSEVTSVWGTSVSLGNLGQYVLDYLNAEHRLSLTADTSSYDPYRASPSGPLQILFAKRDLEQQINDLVQDAFKMGVTVNRYAGSTIHLHAGTVHTAEGPSPQSEEYMAEINALPLLHEQGDGVRAFTGMAMSILTGRHPAVLIDEPEAFLHPPQARRFGRFLAEYAASEDGVQVLVATHSEDIVAGLTSVASTGNRTSLVRLTREGNTNHVAQLPPETVKELYEDPLMKHYDMLNGLFTTGVVLCEADSDCTYYRAVLDVPGQPGVSMAQDSHFTHTGGKARIARAIQLFRSTAIPSVAIFDIDILQNDHEFNALIEAVGADPAIVSPLRNTIISAVTAGVSPLRRTALKAEIEEILNHSNARDVSKGDARKIQEAAAQKSGWRDLKLSGKTRLSGDAANAYESLTTYLEQHGIFILEQGELERLHPAVPQNDKAEWLRTVVESGAYRTSPALLMLQRISSYLEGAQSQLVAVPED